MYEDLPRTKREAQQLGAKRYFTGRLCCHGHLSPRYTYGACIACKSEQRKKVRKIVPLAIRKALLKEANSSGASIAPALVKGCH
tara:strand:- start:1287 stop:1538 length:252 start_codon:yes stop_codon:yes gene_type:complete